MPEKQDDLTVEVVYITPDMARLWLKKVHSSYGRMRHYRIEPLVDDMKKGKWKVTHQAICFDGDGLLRDGRNRLEAVVESGKTVKMAVCRGVPEAAFEPFDMF